MYADAMTERVRARAAAGANDDRAAHEQPVAHGDGRRRVQLHRGRVAGPEPEIVVGRPTASASMRRSPTRRATATSTIGVLCDRARYPRGRGHGGVGPVPDANPGGQGWTFVRAWAPEVFRDPGATLERIRRQVEVFLAADAPAAAEPRKDPRDAATVN